MVSRMTPETWRRFADWPPLRGNKKDELPDSRIDVEPAPESLFAASGIHHVGNLADILDPDQSEFGVASVAGDNPEGPDIKHPIE
jgi:hypothetical protein